MKRVGIFLLLARCHRAENHQRQQRELAKKEKIAGGTKRAQRPGQARSDQVKRAARPGPTRAPHYRGARRRAAREAEEKCRRPAAKLPHWPRKSPQMGPLRRGKPCQSRSASDHASLPWLGAGSPKVRVKDRIGPTGETLKTCLGDGASRRQRHGLPTAGTEDML
jgi:hypothetical protein